MGVVGLEPTCPCGDGFTGRGANQLLNTPKCWSGRRESNPHATFVCRLGRPVPYQWTTPAKSYATKSDQECRIETASRSLSTPWIRTKIILIKRLQIWWRPTVSNRCRQSACKANPQSSAVPIISYVKLKSSLSFLHCASSQQILDDHRYLSYRVLFSSARLSKYLPYDHD